MKILLIKLNHIGDTLLMTPAIRFLRERFPDCILDVVVRKGCESVLEGNPDITRIIPIASPERRKRSLSSSLGEWHAILRTIVNARYDYAFDLSNSDRAKFLMLLSRAKIRSINDWNARLGWKSAAFNRFTHFAWGMEHMVLRDFRAVADLFDPEAVPGALHINTSVDRAELVRKLPFLGGLENYVTIHPVSRWAYKQWLPERWAELADWVRATLGLEVLFTSGPDPGENDHVREILGRCETLHAATFGRTGLRELAHVIGEARLFIGVDTVAMHIAAAVRTPTVALFGASSEWSWRPWKCRHELVSGECSCKATRVFVCDKGRPYPCMERISVSAVKDAVRGLLDGTDE